MTTNQNDIAASTYRIAAAAAAENYKRSPQTFLGGTFEVTALGTVFIHTTVNGVLQCMALLPDEIARMAALSAVQAANVETIRSAVIDAVPQAVDIFDTAERDAERFLRSVAQDAARGDIAPDIIAATESLG